MKRAGKIALISLISVIVCVITGIFLVVYFIVLAPPHCTPTYHARCSGYSDTATEAPTISESHITLQKWIEKDNIESRVSYYLGQVGAMNTKNLQTYYTSISDYTHEGKGSMINGDILYWTNYNELVKSSILQSTGYIDPILECFRSDSSLPPKYQSFNFAFQFGDCNGGILSISKTRTDRRGILCKMNPKRHWRLKEAKLQDIPFHLKQRKAVWRGTPTGQKDRFMLVEKWFNRDIDIDVGFSSLHRKYFEHTWRPFVKGKMSIKEQLRYRYIISVEGNDVATGLKWQLNSNSVVLMPHPTCNSWLMESKLQPFVHYIPIKSDFSDLKSMINWADEHPNKAKRISENATLYMKKFMDSKQEHEIQREVVKRYLDLLHGVEVIPRQKLFFREIYWLPHEARIRYYLGDVFTKEIQDLDRLITQSITGYRGEASIMHRRPLELPDKTESLRSDRVFYICYDELISYSNILNYTISLRRAFDLLDQEYSAVKFPFLWGDGHAGIYATLMKVRTNDAMVISKLNTLRHWEELHRVKSVDLDFSKKLDAVVWRGADNNEQRRVLVSTYSGADDMDIGYCTSKLTSDFVKGNLSIQKQLKFRYIISVQGHDVATGLKWQLLSNSVVLMSKPTVFSWLMEDKLIPYIHYIPLEPDFSDLPQRLQWARSNPEAVEQIAVNATTYMQQFLCKEREDYIHSEVLRIYLEKMKHINLLNRVVK